MIQGYPPKMRLYEMHTVCFLLFMILHNYKLCLSLPNNLISNVKTLSAPVDLIYP